ncbi:redoxin family protein, partial [Terriglobus sp. YAF25]
CSRSLFGEYDSALKMQQAKLAVTAATKLAALSPDDATRSMIEVMAANGALTPKQGEEKSRASKEQAEEAYRLAKGAIQHDKTNFAAYDVEGRAAMLLGNGGEAREIFAMMERNAPAGSAAAMRAHRLASNPDRAINPTMPSFSATTLSGEKLTSDELAGKTVLLDFWATWCPACVEDTDYLKMLANRYKDHGLAVVSVSVDSSEMKWKNYIEENRMRWPQVLDNDKHMRELFNIGAFPTYVLVDENTNICERIVGSREDLQAKLLKILPPASTPAK